MASASIPVQPGDTISGKYRIERMLGAGGVGMVVSARHLALGQVFAIKFLHSSATRETNDVLRFMREAQSAVQLKNEHVARVIDIAELDDGSPYIVLEYLEGQDLHAALRSRGPLPIEQVVDYLLQVCEAVAEAHSIGMVHRDLKPSNFFLTHRPDGSSLVKVLDFGIAKYKIELEEEDVRLTQTRARLGSPVYMSPEQVRDARTVDPRSDIWSLGVSLFELLAETVPFSGDTVTGVAAAITSDPVPPIGRYRSDVTPELASVIEKCLAKRPDDRFQNVAELAHALVAFGPPEGALSLQRINGVLGVAGSSTESRSRSTAGRDRAGRETHATEVSASSATGAWPMAPKRRLLRIGVAVAVVAVAAVLVYARRVNVTGANGAASALSAAESGQSATTALAPPASRLEGNANRSASAAVAANADVTASSTVVTANADVTASSAAVAANTAVTASSAAVAANTAVTTPARTQKVSTPRPSTRVDSTAAKKASTKKSLVGGSLDGIVDTRH